MQTQMIRDVIAKAIAHEELTGATARLLGEVAKSQGVEPTGTEVDSTVTFVREYVEHVPDLLEACDSAATAVGIADYVRPILNAAEQYFISPLDVIFDHLGLIGLTDDAYFAQCLLQTVSETYKRWTTRPLLPMNLAPANELIRSLIGEPQASQLDRAVAETLKHGSVQKAFEGLKGFSSTLPISDPMWEDASIEEMLKAPREALSMLTPAPGRRRGLVPAAPETFPEPPAKPGPEIDAEADTMVAGYEVVIDLYHEKVKAGELDETRQRELAPVLEELAKVVAERPKDAAARTERVDRVHALLNRVKAGIAKPQEQEALSSGSRAEWVNRLLQRIKRYLFIEAGRPHRPGAERDSVEDLFVRVTRAGEALRDTELGTDDASVNELERSTLRPLALEVQNHARRHHMTLADPIWSNTPIDQDPNCVFLSGGPQVWDALARACATRGLNLLTSAGGRDHAQSRWDQLRRGNLTVIDLTGAEGPDPAACYELGIALSLGRSIIPVAHWGEQPPFDTDVVPIYLDEGDADGRLGDALDEALYSHQWGGTHSSVAETIKHVQGSYGSGSASVGVRRALSRLETVGEDPITAHEVVDEVLASTGESAPVLLLSAWPGHYPDKGARRCLHVTPDKLDRSPDVRQIVAEVCGEAGFEQVREDLAVGLRIVRHSWDTLCRFSHIVFDLTGFDPRVLVQLGIAHTLGRKALLVGQGGTGERLFPSLTGLPFHTYTLAEGAVSLREPLNKFLAEGS